VGGVKVGKRRKDRREMKFYLKGGRGEKNTPARRRPRRRRGAGINRGNKKDAIYSLKRLLLCVYDYYYTSWPVFFFSFSFFFITEFPPRRDDVPSYLVRYTRIALCLLVVFFCFFTIQIALFYRYIYVARYFLTRYPSKNS
jgi:hypothetical protein